MHLSRVCPCPPGWPAGCYWYGGSRKCAGKFPHWVETLLEKADPEENTTNLPGEGDGSAAPSQFVQLPKIALPTFDGDLMKWTTFWSQFEAAVHHNPKLNSSNKLAYLRDTIRDPNTNQLCCTEKGTHYEDIVDLLKRRFDKRLSSTLLTLEV